MGENRKGREGAGQRRQGAQKREHKEQTGDGDPPKMDKSYAEMLFELLDPNVMDDAEQQASGR